MLVDYELWMCRHSLRHVFDGSLMRRLLSYALFFGYGVALVDFGHPFGSRSYWVLMLLTVAIDLNASL